MRLEAERGATVQAFAELDSLIAGFLQSLHALTSELDGHPPGPVPDLRDLYRRVERRGLGHGAPPSIGLQLDEFVNSIDTALHTATLETTGHD